MVRCCPASGFGQLLPPYFRFGTILRNATQNGKSVDRRIANNFFFEVMANLIVRLVPDWEQLLFDLKGLSI